MLGGGRGGGRAADQGVHPLSGQEVRPDQAAAQLLPAHLLPWRNVLWAHELVTATVLPLGPPAPLQQLSRSKSVFATFPELPLWARPHAGHWACTKNQMDTLCPPNLVGETTWHPQGYGGGGAGESLDHVGGNPTHTWGWGWAFLKEWPLQ